MGEVRRRVGLGETAIRQMIARGEFPLPFKLGPRAIAFLEGEIDEWIEKRAARRMSST
jgi:prophage regulatory protein